MLSLLYGPALTSIRDYWKTIALTRQTFVSKVMSLLFNMLSRFVIACLPRSICLCWVFIVACRIFSSGLWDLVPSPGIEPRPPALGAQSPSHQTTREVPIYSFIERRTSRASFMCQALLQALGTWWRTHWAKALPWMLLW